MPEATPAAAAPALTATIENPSVVVEPAAATEPTEKDPNFIAKRFAALSKKEAELVRREKESKTKFADLETKASRADELEQVFAAAKENPALLLEKAGLSFDELAQLMLQQATTPKEVLEANKKIEAMEKKLQEDREERQQEKLEADRVKIENAIEGYKKVTVEFLNENSNEYELIHVHNALDDVYAVVERLFDETGEVCSPKEAADQVEEYLLEQAEKALKANKISSRFAPKEPLKEIAKLDVQAIKTPSLTLRNGPASAPIAVSKNTTLSRQEKINRATSALQFKG